MNRFEKLKKQAAVRVKKNRLAKNAARAGAGGKKKPGDGFVCSVCFDEPAVARFPNGVAIGVHCLNSRVKVPKSACLI